MKNKRKILLAAMAIGFGISSNIALAFPSCIDMKEMCDEGSARWCAAYANTAYCHY